MPDADPLTLRPARVVRDPSDEEGPADLDAVVALHRKVWDRWASSPGDWIDADLIEQLATRPSGRPEVDLPVIELDGSMVGVVAVRARPPYSEIEADVFIDPDLDASTTRAVAATAIRAAEAAGLARGSALPADGSSLSVYAFAAEPLVTVLQESGFAYRRSMLLMGRPLDDEVVVQPLPEGVSARSIDRERDLEDLVVTARAFEDHHGDFVADEESLRHILGSATARPDLGAVAWDSDGPVGAVIVGVDGTGGFVQMLMTVRRARGRGIGSALLTGAFAGLQRAGERIVYLSVDSANPTGALGLYERCGMTRADEFMLWSRPLAGPTHG